VNFDSTLLMLSLIPSGVGVVLLMYGRKQQRWPQLVCGVLFLAYPYFTETVFSMIGVGLALGIGLYAALAAGW
jgi:hypothetical protein